MTHQKTDPTPTATPTETVPFFARKVAEAPLAVRTGLRAGLAESNKKAYEPREK